MLQEDGEITIKFSDNQILFSFENCFILSRLIEGEYPNSIGFLWTKASAFLSFLLDGMPEYGAGTVMALASYGDPNRFYSKFREFVHYDDEGRISVDGKVMQFRNGSHDKYENLFGIKSRGKDESITQDHMDFAAGLQRVTNEVLLGLSKRIHKTDWT